MPHRSSLRSPRVAKCFISALGCAVVAATFGPSSTSEAQLATRHYLPPMPAFGDSDLLIELSTPAWYPVPFVLRSRLPAGNGGDLFEQGIVIQGSPFVFLVRRSSNDQNAAGLVGHTLASAATPLDYYGLVVESDAAVNMMVSVLTSNNRDIFSSKGSNGLGTEFYAWSSYNTTGNSTSTANNDSGHFVSVMAIHDDTVVTVDGPDLFFGFDLGSGPRSVTLDQFQSLVLLTRNNQTITGTRITSTRPISVISGDLHPEQAGSANKDSAIDNLVPTNLAGSKFVVGNLFEAAAWGNLDSAGVPVGNRYVQLVAVEDDSEVTQYDANGDVVRVITFENAGDVKVYHLPGNAGTGYYFEATSSTAGYQANDFLMYWNSSAETTGGEMGGAQLPALRGVNSQGSFCSGSDFVEYHVPVSPRSFFVYVPMEELSTLEVDDGDGGGFRRWNDASLATASVSTIGSWPIGISMVRYGGAFASAGTRVAFRAPRRIHVGVGTAPSATSALGLFAGYDYAFLILDPDYELPTDGYSVPTTSVNHQPETVRHCVLVNGVCSSTFRISSISTSAAAANNLAPELVAPEGICFDFTPDPVVGAGTRSYPVGLTITDDNGDSRSVEVRFEYTFTDEEQPLTRSVPEGTVDVISLLSADPDVSLWRIADGDDAAQFTIDEDGLLQFVTPPAFLNPQDADGDNVYEVVVELEAISGSVFQQPIFVFVTSTQIPEIGGPTDVVVLEGTTKVTSLTATHAPGTTLSWSIIGGPNASDLTVSDTGVVSFVTPPAFDPEDTNSYEVDVQVEDSAGRTATRTIRVSVASTATATLTGPGVVYVLERTNEVATYETAATEGTITWNLEGVDFGDFVIDQFGSVRFRFAPVYGAGGNNRRSLTVVAVDAEGTRLERAVTVNVLEDPVSTPCTEDSQCGSDYSALVCDTSSGVCQVGCRGEGGNGCPAGFDCSTNDASIGDCEVEGTPPVIAGPLTVRVTEGTSIVATLTVHHFPGTTVTWRIGGGPQGSLFTIDDEGQLSFLSPPIFDLQGTNQYLVVVEVEDSNGRGASETITVIVEAATTMELFGPTTVDVLEGTLLVAQLTTQGLNGDLTWSIADSLDGALFTVDASGQVSFRVAPLFDPQGTNSYQVTVEVEDNAGNKLNKTITVNVLRNEEVDDCTTDVDCGDTNSGIVCGPTGQCQLGCRGSDGNGCPSGQVCSSTSDAIGSCQVEDGEGSPPTDGGCSCGTEGNQQKGAGVLLLALAVLVLATRRRRISLKA